MKIDTARLLIRGDDYADFCPYGLFWGDSDKLKPLSSKLFRDILIKRKIRCC